MGNLVDWPKDSKKDGYYVNEEEIDELVYVSQQPKAKAFRNYCCKTMFQHIPQQLTNKMEEDHQQTITEKYKENTSLPSQDQSVMLAILQVKIKTMV